MLEKHKSKLLKGFEKMVARQHLKERSVKIKLPPAITLPKKFKGKYKHHLIVSNSIWNGMNLMVLRNRFYIHRVGGMYGKFILKQNGMYALSTYGQKILKNKKIKHHE